MKFICIFKLFQQLTSSVRCCLCRAHTSATRQVRQQWFSVCIFPPMLFFGLTGNRPQSAPACSFLRWLPFKRIRKLNLQTKMYTQFRKGRKFGNWKLTSYLGGGGNGEVWGLSKFRMERLMRSNL